jgi:hypothetical protein
VVRIHSPRPFIFRVIKNLQPITRLGVDRQLKPSGVSSFNAACDAIFDLVGRSEKTSGGGRADFENAGGALTERDLKVATARAGRKNPGPAVRDEFVDRPQLYIRRRR